MRVAWTLELVSHVSICVILLGPGRTLAREREGGVTAL